MPNQSIFIWCIVWSNEKENSGKYTYTFDNIEHNYAFKSINSQDFSARHVSHIWHENENNWF